MKRLALLVIVLMLALAGPLIAQDDDLLHVPSPEWQDQIIYFVMIDRFYDGDPSNNDQGMDEFDPEDRRKFQGGDLAGITQQLDYIEGLGATAIWITPPVANQWWDPVVDFGGYHGYWAENFKEIDAHFGDLETYQALSRALHGRDMYLIQDIVTNHTGNFFTYLQPDGSYEYNPDDPTEGFRLNSETVPVTAPSQEPFQLNDVTNPDHREAAIYNWTQNITDYGNPVTRLTRALADLDDLNTENPVVREAMKDSYTYWIEQAGVDGFRIDTVIYVEHPFWHDFIHAENGVNAAAAATGRDDFFTFGEAFIGSAPFDDAGEREIVDYLGTDAAPEMSAVLNFPLHFTIGRTFADGAPTAAMTYRLEATEEIFPNPALLPVFIDNHDVDRFLNRGSLDGLKQSLMFMMTTPGIPIIYYGTEQAFTEQRASMFAAGWGSGGVDHFDTESEMYQFIAELSALRTENRVFTRGTLDVLADNPDGPGVFAYRRDYEDDTALVLFNTADQAALLQDMVTGLPAGTVLEPLADMGGLGELVVGAGGTLTTELPPRAGAVYRPAGTVEVADAGAAVVSIADDLAGGAFSEDFTVNGTAEPGAEVRLAINGVISDVFVATADDTGAFEIPVRIDVFPIGESESNLTVYAPEQRIASETVTIATSVTISGEAISAVDAAGDDAGPYGIYEYPQDVTFGQQMDMVGASITPSGGNLLVEIETAEMTTVWGPENGFDHVMFHIFIDLPGVEVGGGVQALPRLNAEFTEEFTWDYVMIAEGWNGWVYSAEGATADDYALNMNPVPEIVGDADNRRVQIAIPSAAMGNPETTEGTRVVITTWDWNGPDATYRDLVRGGGQWAMGGADAAEGFPLVMDTLTVNWEPSGISPFVLDEAVLAEVSKPDYTLTFTVTVPEGTPSDDPLYLAGPFNEWTPNDEAYRFDNNGDGTYTLVTTFKEGTALEYRLTRGNWLTSEKLDPDDRFANHELLVTADTAIDLTITGWWDD